ncbi:MAG: hypothetical protein JWN80_180 [Microbacteriaceae bacterium]|jgi:hypothetical protein|nr:hypothetical protein [Microbacteriaceae bacterium]
MTVVTGIFDIKREGKTMTTTVVELRSGARYEPSLADRVIMRVSLTTLIWARQHSQRSAASRELRLLRALEIRDFERSNHQSLAVALRQPSHMPR